MKTAIFCCLIGTLSPLSAANPVPAYHFENVTATNGSTQQSVLFTTVPGVKYRVELSDDLLTWVTVTEVYGVGQQVATALREIAPAPAPPEPTVPATGPAGVVASILLQPSGSPLGGTVVSWPSLDTGAAMIMLIPESMDPSWQDIPLFCSQYGDIEFAVSHPPGSVAPPATSPFLDTKDSAMIAQLRASLPAMNTEVTLSASLHGVPGPAEPSERRFLRIAADWSIDSDGDGSPDWMEFQMMADSQHPGHSLADPFAEDRNSDGVPDGQQLDFDGDSQPDTLDSSPANPGLDTRKQPLWRYACFPLGSHGSPPLTVNNRGQVLYPQSVWFHGEMKMLQGDPDVIESFQAMGMNDSGQIVGQGTIKVNRHTTQANAPGTQALPSNYQGLVWWENSDIKVVPVEVDNVYATTVWSPEVVSSFAKQFPSDCLVDNDGNFIGGEKIKNQPDPPQTRVWAKTSSGFTSTKKTGLEQSGFSPLFTHAPGYIWGPYGGGTHVIGAETHDFSNRISRLAPIVKADGSSSLGAFGFGSSPWIKLSGNAWDRSEHPDLALDMSDNGVAIRGSLSLWQDDYDGDFSNWVPKLPAGVDTGILVDAGKSGWLLARGASGSASSLAMPVMATDDEKNSGVDSFSLTSPEGCELRDNWQAWIMVPAGGAPVGFKFDSLATTDAPVTLTLPSGLSFAGGATTMEVTERQKTLFVQATSAAAGTEQDLKISLGDANSISKPIGLKIMKPRVLKVTVCTVAMANGTQTGLQPDLVPTTAEIETYLNGVFSKQVNATFNVSLVNLPTPVDWDTSPKNGYLDLSGTEGSQSPEQDIISDAFNTYRTNQAPSVPEPNISIFLLGGTQLIEKLADGFTVRTSRTCWIRGWKSLRYNKPEQLDVIAHELGHALIGIGHPDQDRGPARLPGSDANQRLMASRTSPFRVGSSLLVKGEWDAAEDWFEIEENQNRLPH